MTCLEHNDARVIAVRALTERRRPKSTIPRGLYDSARPWLDLGVVIGDCPRCRSTIASWPNNDAAQYKYLRTIRSGLIQKLSAPKEGL